MSASVAKSTQVVGEFIVTVKTQVEIESPTITLQVVQKTEYHETTVKFTGYKAEELANDFVEQVNSVPPETADVEDGGAAPASGEADNGSGSDGGVDEGGSAEPPSSAAEPEPLAAAPEVLGDDGRGAQPAQEGDQVDAGLEQ